LTSLIQTARGVMTVQTEIVGEPAQLVTIVDFRGRVLKIWRSALGVDPAGLDSARRWHQKIDGEVRESLTRVARRPADRSAIVGASLFVEAMRAYAVRDYAGAETILSGCERLLPHDRRIDAARAAAKRGRAVVRDETYKAQ
jgi:hypothetical protein